MPFPVIAAIGAGLGALGSIFGASSQADQQKKNRKLAQQRTQYFQNLFNDLQSQGAAAVEGARTRLGDIFGGAQQRLQDLFTAQGGQFQNILGDIQTSGRQQAAQSGLIGGGVESALVSPAIQRTATQFGTQAAQSQLGLEQLFLQAMAGLDRSNIARLGGLSQLAMGQLGTAGGQQLATQAGQQSINPLLAGIGGGLSGLGAGLDIQRFLTQLNQPATATG